MDPTRFEHDLLAKPETLGALADRLVDSDPWAALPTPCDRLIFVGMGSSHYAASVAAARLRARGVDAVAELASTDLLPAVWPGTVAIAVSAGSGSRETRSAVEALAGRCPVFLLTNNPTSPLAGRADQVVPMLAGPEGGGVACRSYQHTLALLLALEQKLTRAGSAAATATLVRRSAAACADLLDRRTDWLPTLRDLLAGPDGVHVVAPARRFCSAQQSALMLREGPRIPAVGCETGDWSHVDVYLTRTTDYRLMLLPGSPWQDELLRWTAERGSTVVGIGEQLPGTDATLRYAGDTKDDVRLLSETTVAELLAADLWRSADRG